MPCDGAAMLRKLPRAPDLGRHESALVAIEEAMTLRRALAEANPDAFLPDLARSLNNRAFALNWGPRLRGAVS